MHSLEDYNMQIDDPFAPPDRMAGSSILHSLPPEIFEKICKNLEPVWLMNLSITCYAMSVKLSVEVGNRIWYNVMPQSIWQEPERYQDEEELCALWLRKHHPEIFSPSIHLIDMYQFAMTPNNVPANISSPSRSGCVFPHSTTDDVDFSIMKSGQDLYVLKGCDLSLSPSLYSTISRERVQALGGSYQSCFNYRREFMGRFLSKRHCYICLTKKDTDGRDVRDWLWNMLMCPDCMKEYTISDAAIRELRVAGLNPLSNWVELPPCKQNRIQRYFLPEINMILREWTDIDYRANIRNIQQHRHLVQMERLEVSRIESIRRSARQAIVQAAQMIWEGIDPAAGVELPCVMTRSKRLHCMPTTSRYRFYRERWAPTSKLHEFLFPAHSLSQYPTQLALSSDTRYLNDPTLTKFKDFETRGFRWVIDQASDMLRLLVVWDHANYKDKGYGGYVSTWVEAAKKYHIARLEQYLISGATANLNYVPPENHGAHLFRHIREIREKSGLEPPGSTTMIPNSKRPARCSYLYQHSFEEYVRLEREAREQERKRAIFNKLIRHTSQCCPISSMQCYPIGFEGLVEHMRLQHPNHFWSRDNWNTIG